MSDPYRGPKKGGGKRSTVQGWTPGAARRHRDWLQSVNPDRLPAPHSYAFTLTLRDTPEDAAAFHRLRHAWVKRMNRLGCVAGHWVVEWQKRGTPHLHGALFFAQELTAMQRHTILKDWANVCEKAEIYARLTAQHVTNITDQGGWGKYCSKHSGRSSAHYQRQGMPDGWESSGRVWGKWGNWENSVSEGEVFRVDYRAWWQLRRMMRAWALADASRERSAARREDRLKSLRKAYRRVGTNPDRSRWAPMNEWIPAEVQARMLDWLMENGHVLEIPEQK